MTTKKERRAQVAAKTEKFMGELARTNAIALDKSRQHRELEESRKWESNHEKNHSKKREKDCPFCQREAANS